MTITEQLSRVLRGEDAADLSPDARQRLEALAHAAQAEEAVARVRDECASRLRQGNASPGVEYLLAAACALNGDVERALQALLALGDKLAAEARWEPLAAVAERALGLQETQAAARLLVRAHEGLRKDPARIEALERATAIIPDDLELGLLLAQRLGEAGDGERRREQLAAMLPGFAAAGRYNGLEEAALEFTEHREHDGLLELVALLPGIARKGAPRECAQLAATALPELVRAGRAGDALASLRATALAAVEKDGPSAGAPFRTLLPDALRQGPGRSLPDVESVIAGSGLLDPEQPLPEALERFDAIAALPPGGAVHHASFGTGRVVSNDAVNVVIDFPRSKNHRMPYAAARRTLAVVPENDLRVLKLGQPAELQRLIRDEPAEVLARALEALGGSGDAQKLKVYLVGSDVVPATEWNAFWRKARAGAPKHPRIDASRAFEQIFRRRAESEVGAAPRTTPLPAVAPRKPVRTNLATVRKFLEQHPDSEAALAQRFGRYVQRAMEDEEGLSVDRARAGLTVSRWFPDRREGFIAVLKQLWEQGLAITDLTGEDEQRALLEASHAAGVEADAILSALDSRFSSVREQAEQFRALLDDAGRSEMRRTLLQHAARYPGAALRLIDDVLDERGTPPDAWLVLYAALALIEDKPRPSTAEKVLRWFEAGGAFDAKLGGTTCPEDVRLRVRVLLRQWRSSDRFLFPALEALERLGLAEEAGTVMAERQIRADKLFDRVGQQSEDADVPVMTRATFVRLQQELERLERELRTTIPATIQKARELGDLKENAEYHSAKMKQANVSKLVATLQIRLGRARFVDDLDYRDGIAGLGTEVTLEHDGEMRRYWILGENEHHHGEHVVSFQAPLGRALSGHVIGDEVELGEGAERGRWRIVSVERKLPAHETTA
ncbi:MAG TPA: GreA/GreB family elongation factor [Candidatus Eisenbacteria bacterium]|nr:GreA/GreB family elongation factor [Candidatus Eisenbacteria bacterium]